MASSTAKGAGGCKTYSVIAQNNPNAAVIKATKGRVYGWLITNLAASPRYVKLYDDNNAPTNLDTPAVRLAIPSSGDTNGAKLEANIGDGIAFANGIGIRIVTGASDGDNNAPTANDVVVNIWYR